MKNTRLKNQNGFAASDALIAVLIIALFAGLIATISYNIYLSNNSIKRMSKATEYIVDMFEYIDRTNYDDVTKENLTNYFNGKYYYEDNGVTVKSDAQVKLIEEGENSDTPFTAKLSITKYNQTEGNEDKLDLVQEVVMTVTYKLGNKEQKIEMKTSKSRENFETPNKPSLKMLEIEEGYNLYPIKKANEDWIICDEKDNYWYNYKWGNWALAIMTEDEYSIGDEIDIYTLTDLQDVEKVYVWIPRYAYNSSNNSIEFLFSNSNNYIEKVEEYNNIVPINTSEYTIPNEFSNGQEQLIGIWDNTFISQAFKNLDKVYPLGNL